MTAFVTVAELEGFAAAARQLERSPAAVTRLVAALEQQLGLRLLQRTTRSVRLTDAGARYLDRAKRILGDLGEAEAAAQAERVAPSGRLVVAAPAMFGRIHVAPRLSRYLARHPAVTGELLLSDRPVSLVDEGVDVAVLPDSSLTPGEVFADSTAAQVCVSGYARRVRNVLPEQYLQVYAGYGLTYPQPPGSHELDHLVPLELGGDNSNRNLWPEPALPVPGFHQKDELENFLHDQVCAGRLALSEAQRGIASDWVALYQRFLGGGQAG